MARQLPKAQTIYTTRYTNWRGTDYTNDPSNVWYRRSPSGLNMLPNLDGQPFKRNGWIIEFTSADFCYAVDPTMAVVDVDQYKVDYFELNGVDYLFFFTSLGCFYYTDSLYYIDKSWETYAGGMAGEVEQPYYYSKSYQYKEGEFTRYNSGSGDVLYRRKAGYDDEPPETFNASHWDEVEEEDCWKPFPQEGDYIDYSKAFFFEGGGRAAYYLFVGNVMYWFDGERLHEAHPFIPTVLTMCDANGVGTILYDTNILTERRAIEYTCEEGGTQYAIPDGYETKTIGSTTYPVGIWNVYRKGSKGQWYTVYDWTATDGMTVTLDSAPTGLIEGQPNLRIIYCSANISVTSTLVSSPQDTLTVKKAVKQSVKQRYYPEAKKWLDVSGTSKTESTTYSNVSKPTIALVNPKTPVDAVAQHLDSTWISAPVGITCTVDSYGKKVTLSGSNNGSTAFTYAGTSTSSTSTSYGTTFVSANIKYRYKYTTKTTTKKIPVRIRYTQWQYVGGEASTARNAFFSSSKSLVYGNGIINQVFFTASHETPYNTRVWYSAATNPYYVPDTNYIEVGATDKSVIGLIKVGDYLGVIKQGGATETSIYLAYATSFEDVTTYAVKQSVNGIGAVSNGAFNILNDEPLFLSAEGVMGIEPAENESRKIRNRSYYINKRLIAEPSLESAFSFVYGGMYWLGINNHCYVLDGAQKTSWENTKTNLQYECYYLENVPAKCFARKDDMLWFIDGLGNVCRFRNDSDSLRYVDAYDVEALSDPDKNIYKATSAPTVEDGRLVVDANNVYAVESTTKVTTPYQYSELAEFYSNGLSTNVTEFSGEQILDVFNVSTYLYDAEENVLTRDADFTTSIVSGDTICSIAAGDSAFSEQAPYTEPFQIAYTYSFASQNMENVKKDDVFQYGNSFYTVEEVLKDSDGVTTGYAVVEGVPIKAVWGTIADDDSSANYYKKLQKKGSMVALMPMSDSGVKVSVIPDEKDPIFVGETETGTHVLPFDYFLKKKVKKYKRLQIVCENETYNDGFGVDEIIKCYTIGNYAKK